VGDEDSTVMIAAAKRKLLEAWAKLPSEPGVFEGHQKPRPGRRALKQGIHKKDPLGTSR